MDRGEDENMGGSEGENGNGKGSDYPEADLVGKAMCMITGKNGMFCQEKMDGGLD